MIMNLQHWENRENLKKENGISKRIIKQILINIIQLYEVVLQVRPSLMNESVFVLNKF